MKNNKLFISFKATVVSELNSEVPKYAVRDRELF